MKTLLFVLLSSFLVKSAAHADPPSYELETAADALVEGDYKRAITLLSPPPIGGPETCVLGEALLQDKQSERAMLYLNRCYSFEPDADLLHDIAKLKQTLQHKKLAPVSLTLRPSTATASIASGLYQPDTFASDDDLWLPKGSYRISVAAEGYLPAEFLIQVDSSDRMLVPLALSEPIVVPSREIDMSKDAGAQLGAVTTSTDQRPKTFDTLLAKRYQAPDPIIREQSKAHSSKLWPVLTGLGSVALLTSGVLWQREENTTAAWASYGSGVTLLGLSGYWVITGTW